MKMQNNDKLCDTAFAMNPCNSNSKQSLVKIIKILGKVPPKIVCISAVSAIIFIGFLSYVTNPLVTSSLLYLIPILVITHSFGFRFGFFTSLFAALIWLSADLYSASRSSYKFYENNIIPYWNVSMRLGSFLVAVTLVSAIRQLNEDLERRVNERTADLEAKILEKRELEKTILEISDREQVRIGHDLHDGICQQLVSAAFSANILRDELSKESHKCSRYAIIVSEMVDEAITQARNIARGLYPARLEAEGFEMALQELVANMSVRFGVQISLDYFIPFTKCNSSVGIHLYRIAQEAIANAAKHACAHEIVVSLTSNDGCILLTVQDDGNGIGVNPLNPLGMGLRIMDYRSRLIGGIFTIHNLPYQGTKVTCVLDEKIFTA